jgi:hypothetical protein
VPHTQAAARQSRAATATARGTSVPAPSTGHPVFGPLVGDERCQAHRVASFTHPTTERLRTLALHPQLGVLAAQSGQLRALVGAQALDLISLDLVLLRPASAHTPRSSATWAIGLPRLSHDPDRSLAELRIESTSCLWHGCMRRWKPLVSNPS